MKLLPTLLVALSSFFPASSAFAEETAKKSVPLVACIEPAVMRTEAARLLPGSKKTVIVPAKEDEFGLSRLSKEEFAATGLKWEEFLTQAAAGAAAHLKTLKPDIHRDAKNVAQYAVLSSKSQLTAGIVMCPEFFEQFREVFGDRLVVLIPDRFTVYVFPRGFTDFQTMGPEILEKHRRSIWPCSQEAFEITADGLKCLGSFDGEAVAPSGPKPAPDKSASRPAAKPGAPKTAPPAKRPKKP
jgi:hypothetical protein